MSLHPAPGVEPRVRVYLGGKRFPSTPNKIQLADASTILSYDIISRGTIAMPRGYQPSRCTLEGTFFGASRALFPGLVRDWVSPYELCRDLAGWCKEADLQGPRRLEITDLGVSFDAFPESFQWLPKGGFGDVDYQLSLYEERPLAADGRTWTTAPGKTAVKWQYRTVPGDTLATIAGQKLGDSSRWQEIRALNTGLPEATAEEIPPGTILTMPPTSWQTAPGVE